MSVSSFSLRVVFGVFLGMMLCPSLAQAVKLPTVAGVVASNRILTRLEEVLTAADLNTLLASKGPFTFFAPTDSAFAKLAPDFVDKLLLPQNKEQLQKLVFYHLIEGKKLSSHDLATGIILNFSNLPLTIKKNKIGLIQVQGSKVLRADIHCQNGTVHQIDAVLIPPGFTLASADTAVPVETNGPPVGNPFPVVPPGNETNLPPHFVPALPVNP